MTQMLLFGRFGFVRLLGVGHLVWIPMVIWLATRLDAASHDAGFATWITLIVVADAASLVVDARDVWRYARGDRSPHLR